MRRMKVLFVPHPVDEVQYPWGEDVLECCRQVHDVDVFDHDQPTGPQFSDKEAVVDLGGNISAELIDVAAQAGVKFVQAQTNGLDHVAVDDILDSGMLLAHCPGELSSVALAESAMMFMLLFGSQYNEARANFDSGKIFFPTGVQLKGRTLGIIGFGNSGQELARRAKAFEMKIMAIDVRPIDPEIIDEIQPDFLGGADDTDHVISQSDFISVHLHLTPQTHHLIDARRIGLMKSTACVVNVARGGLIDEEALYQALVDDRIGGAGLDAFSKEPPDVTLPVYKLHDVYVTPHTGGSSDGTSRLRAEFAAENLNRFARGEEVLARVTK